VGGCKIVCDKGISMLIRQGLDYFILHTGQYYSYNLDKIFFEELELPKPKCNLDVGAGTHAEETGKMPILEKLYLYVKN